MSWCATTHIDIMPALLLLWSDWHCWHCHSLLSLCTVVMGLVMMVVVGIYIVLCQCCCLWRWLSEVSDNLVSSQEHVVKLGSAPSHIPSYCAFIYLTDGWLTFVCCYIPCHVSSVWLSEPILLTVFSLLYVDLSTSAFVSEAEVVEVACAPGTIHQQSVHKYVVPSIMYSVDLVS